VLHLLQKSPAYSNIKLEKDWGKAIFLTLTGRIIQGSEKWYTLFQIPLFQ
jgi:hypothetical protein